MHFEIRPKGFKPEHKPLLENLFQETLYSLWKRFESKPLRECKYCIVVVYASDRSPTASAALGLPPFEKVGLYFNLTRIWRRPEFLEMICAHELQHIRQVIEGRLVRLDNKEFLWDGQRYSSEIPWEERPWELDACKAAEELTGIGIEEYREYERKLEGR